MIIPNNHICTLISITLLALDSVTVKSYLAKAYFTTGNFSQEVSKQPEFSRAFLAVLEARKQGSASCQGQRYKKKKKDALKPEKYLLTTTKLKTL